MRFAVFTASTPEWTPEEAAAELADAGYDGVEWRVVDQQPANGVSGFWSGNRATWPFASFLGDVPKIRELTERAGLGMPSLGTYVRCDRPDDVAVAMRAARELGVPQLRVTVPAYDPAAGYRAQWDRARAQYADVAALAERHGVRALVEVHQGTLTPNPHAAAAFVADLDPRQVAVIHDIGNMVLEGWTIYRQGLEALGDHLGHVHVKNARWVESGQRDDGTTRWRAEWAPMRAGIVDFRAHFAALRAIGYDGWVSVEDFSTETPLRQRIRDNLALLRSSWEQAGT